MSEPASYWVATFNYQTSECNGRTCVWVKGRWEWPDWIVSFADKDFYGVPTSHNFIMDIRKVNREELEFLVNEARARKALGAA